MKNKLLSAALIVKIAFFITFFVCTVINAQDPNVSVMFNAATKSIQAVSADNATASQEQPQPSMPIPFAAAANTQDNDKNAQNKSVIDEGEADVYLNFENVSLSSVVNYLAERKKINLVPHKDLENQKVSLTTRKPLTLNRAWNILLTLLEMNGFSIIQVDNLHRVVASKDNGVEPLPYYTSQITAPEDLPDSDLVIRYMYFFKNIKPDAAQDILKSMIDGDKSIQQIKDLQAVIIKEKCHNIKAALKVIKELDTGGLRQSIRIMPLKEADADTVQKLFQDITGANNEGDDRLKFVAADNTVESAYFSSTTKIISDSSKNSLILLGTPANIDKICNFIYKYIDVPIGSADSRIHIRELRYAKAESLKPLLEAIIKPPSGQGNDKTSIVGQFKFFEDVIIAADAATSDDSRGSGNRLIISANQGDWKRLNDFIDKLDKPAPQVAFEVLIVDVTLKMDKELGAQLQSQGVVGAGLNRMNFNNLGSLSGIKQETYTKDLKTIPAYNFSDIIAGFSNPGTFATLGTPGVAEANKIWAVIRSYFNTNNNHIVSQPYLVANNYQECSVKFGSTQKVNGPLDSQKGENKTRQKVDKDASTEIKLTPQINYDGIVTLKLDMSINDFVATDSDAGPNISKRTVTTKINMASGEVLVLGGMTKSNLTINSYKTPLLGDIPILGNLFKSNVKQKDEVNLYVFIRPSIIKPSFEGSPDEYTQLKLDYAKYQMIKNDNYSKDNDPVQQWFFKPTNHSIKNTLADARNGVFRPIDDFTYGKQQPKTVDIGYDSYYQASTNIENRKKAKPLKSRRKQQT